MFFEVFLEHRGRELTVTTWLFLFSAINIWFKVRKTCCSFVFRFVWTIFRNLVYFSTICETLLQLRIESPVEKWNVILFSIEVNKATCAVKMVGSRRKMSKTSHSAHRFFCRKVIDRPFLCLVVRSIRQLGRRPAFGGLRVIAERFYGFSELLPRLTYRAKKSTHNDFLVGNSIPPRHYFAPIYFCLITQCFWQQQARLS